jgi:hypothetical protein
MNIEGVLRESVVNAVFVCALGLFVIVFMTSDCICNHAWIVL